MQKVCLLALFGSGFSASLFAAVQQDWKVWIAGASGIMAAMLWLGGMVWRASGERQKVLSKICTQADRMENLTRATEEDLSGLKVAVADQATQFRALISELAEWRGTCRARKPIYEKMLTHLTEGP